MPPSYIHALILVVGNLLLCRALLSAGFVGRQPASGSEARIPSLLTSVSREKTGGDVFQLPPALKKMVQQLRSSVDDRMRYQTLLHMANQLKPMQAQHKLECNKVPGCTSVVYIHATRKGPQIFFEADSDSQLTKGLAALLAVGLSGSTAEAIDKVNPEFIRHSKLTASLTPSRNSGFLNMLGMMKIKARQLTDSPAGSAAPQSTSADERSLAMRQRVEQRLAVLRPTAVEIRDTSHEHAGHLGDTHASRRAPHISVTIVAHSFEGQTLVQRHRAVYALLADELRGGLHSLSITARSPSEREDAGAGVGAGEVSSVVAADGRNVGGEERVQMAEKS